MSGKESNIRRLWEDADDIFSLEVKEGSVRIGDIIFDSIDEVPLELRSRAKLVLSGTVASNGRIFKLEKEKKVG